MNLCKTAEINCLLHATISSWVRREQSLVTRFQHNNGIVVKGKLLCFNW